MSQKTIYIISGPSGVGKGTLIREVLKERTLKVAVSATTRQPRSGEKNGVDYFFLTNEEFSLYIEKDNFLEWCQVHTNRYGTLKSEVLDPIKQGQDVLLEIDVQGAMKIKVQVPEVVTIFIAPPRFEDLSKRLEQRNTEGQSEISKRLLQAENELSEMKRYDHVVINDDLSKATDEILTIMNQRS